MLLTKVRNSVIRVKDESGRQAALKVLRETYRNEKNWTSDEASLFSEEELAAENISWFVVFEEENPVGVLRVLYDPPLAMYAKYGFEMIAEGLNVDQFISENRIAEIGRFAVLREHRTKITVVGALMRAAGRDTIMRGYTHYITDIFENEEHNPYKFHTRIMGFIPVATHNVGELNCLNRRITLVLNIKAAYNKLKRNGNWIYRFLTEGWDAKLHERLTL